MIHFLADFELLFVDKNCGSALESACRSRSPFTITLNLDACMAFLTLNYASGPLITPIICFPWGMIAGYGLTCFLSLSRQIFDLIQLNWAIPRQISVLLFQNRMVYDSTSQLYFLVQLEFEGKFNNRRCPVREKTSRTPYTLGSVRRLPNWIFSLSRTFNTAYWQPKQDT